MKVDEKAGSRVLIIEPGDTKINDARDALDLMATANHVYESVKLLIPKECFEERFFDLKTGLAGEILQKYTTYGVRVAIVGDFSEYGSKSLRDFIYESNKGKQVNFLPDEEQALEALHS